MYIYSYLYIGRGRATSEERREDERRARKEGRAKSESEEGKMLQSELARNTEWGGTVTHPCDLRTGVVLTQSVL